MPPALNRPDPPALWLNVGVAILGALLMNGLIFGLGWEAKTRAAGGGPEASFAPPGWVVGAVWTLVLLPLLAVARWRMNHFTQADTQDARGWVTALLVSCLAWPLYSLALGSRVGGLAGNVGTLALAGYAVARLWPWSAGAALCVAPTAGWLLFATAIILREIGWF